MRENEVCAFETDSFHDGQEILEELLRSDLFLLHFGSIGVQLSQILVAEDILQSTLEVLVVESGVMKSVN